MKNNQYKTMVTWYCLVWIKSVRGKITLGIPHYTPNTINMTKMTHK